MLKWSREHFGEDAAGRYEALLLQAFRDLLADPTRLGARQRDELGPGTWVYHLASSREAVMGPRVGQPRHIIVYRIQLDVLQVLRVLHDSRDLVRHVPG